MPKHYLSQNVLDAARERISWTFDHFKKIYVSFSGGKDSTVMLHLVMDEAKRRNELVGVLFIDLEGQYRLTIDHIHHCYQEYRHLGYLPVTCINSDREDRSDRIAATIRHNRARGKHQISAMSDIVVELKRRNWNDEKIGRELGMDPDEVLRLSQISGLAEMFADKDFSMAWEAEQINEEDALRIEEEFVSEDDPQ